jgi:hypothetical protein
MPSMATGPVTQSRLPLSIEPLTEELFVGMRKAEGLHFGALGIIEGGEEGGGIEELPVAAQGEAESLSLLAGGMAVSLLLWPSPSLL